MLAKKEEIPVNVLEHKIVPKTVIISEKEKKNLFEKLSIDENTLPRIKHNDPLAKALEAKAGDVLKIERRDPTAKYFYYRLVV